MNKIALGTLLSICFVTTSTVANDTSVSTVEKYESTMLAIQNTCPSCAEAISTVLGAMNRQCDFPQTAENIRFITTNHPVYAFTLAANTLLEGNETIQQSFNEAIVANVNCWNVDSWIESTRDAMSDSDNFQSVLVE